MPPQQKTSAEEMDLFKKKAVLRQGKPQISLCVELGRASGKSAFFLLSGLALKPGILDPLSEVCLHGKFPISHNYTLPILLCYSGLTPAINIAH